MLIHFTIDTQLKHASRYVLKFESSIIPVIGSNVCFLCKHPDGEDAYYLNVIDVVYYPLKRELRDPVMGHEMEIHVIVDGRRMSDKDLRTLTSTQNSRNPGIWQKNEKPQTS